MYDDCILPYIIEFCAKINQLKFRLNLRSIQSYNEEKKYPYEYRLPRRTGSGGGQTT